tara:strand:+ start:195 stop:392 length:198 start_codon:yes stop_codon:yes gene_type:complete
MSKNKKFKKVYDKSFNSFNSFFTPEEYLKLKGDSLIKDGIDCEFDFMDSKEFSEITKELKGKFNE